jgi:hypothetical protein
MPNSPSSSFIPRQGPAKRSRQVVSRQVHIFSVLSYVLFFGALAASAGVYLYLGHVETQLREEVVALDAAIANFSTEKMEQVKVFNTRLTQAHDRVRNSVSTVSIFESLELSMAKSATIQTFGLQRIDDEKFLLTANVDTDTFDSALFQRGLYERNPVIETVSFEDVGIEEAGEEGGSGGVTFKAELSVPLSAVPYSPVDSMVPLTDTTVVDIDSLPAVGTSTEQDVSSDNESTL